MYFKGRHNSLLLYFRDLISFWVPCSLMESSRKFSDSNDLFFRITLANAAAPLTPIGFLSKSNTCSLSFVRKAFAKWHAPSGSMQLCDSVRLMRVWFVFRTEANEMVFLREKFEYDMYKILSVVLWQSPLMINSTHSGGRSLQLTSRYSRLVDDDSSSLRAWQSSTSIVVLHKARFLTELWVVSCLISGMVPPWPMAGLKDKQSCFRQGVCGIRWASVAQDSEFKWLESKTSDSILLINCFGNFNRSFIPSDEISVCMSFNSKNPPVQLISSSTAPRTNISIPSSPMTQLQRLILQVWLLWDI